MLQVDVLSGYVICGAGSLVGAAMLRIAETNDPRTQDALRLCGWGFVILGIGLMPAALGEAAAHAAAQFSLAFGSLAGMTLIARGLGALQGRPLTTAWMTALIAAFALTSWAAMQAGPHVFGIVYAANLTGLATLLIWLIRGFVLRPRDPIELALGAAFISLAVTAWVRLAFALEYHGPAQADLLYAPAPLKSIFAVLYGVLPMIVASLLLTWVNARLRQQLSDRAITDELTGIMTRRALRELAPALIEQQRKLQRDVAVLMLDLDHFKRINDSFGHATGDAVLQLAASTLKAQLRVDSLIARYGGEEFVVIVPVEDLQIARRVAERLRLAVAGVDWQGCLKLARGVTVSVGVAIVGPNETFDVSLGRADEALYRAKRDGRDQCQVSLAAA